MSPQPPSEPTYLDAARDVAATALGTAHRDDPALPGTGGPAGNARLTAWIGLLLLPLFAAELVTLLSLEGLLSWHIAIGVVLIPPALVKTATTGWRILRYYTGAEVYREAGPPPLLLRVLGPLVVLTTLALLGTGVVLLVVGPSGAFTPLVTIAGHGVSVLTLHQACTLAWAVATGLHVLGRLVPAVQLTMSSARSQDPPAGGWLRTCVFVGTLAVAALAAVLALSLGQWSGSDLHHHEGSERFPAGSEAD
jgi:hypothetical protein